LAIVSKAASQLVGSASQVGLIVDLSKPRNSRDVSALVSPIKALIFSRNLTARDAQCDKRKSTFLKN